ncbi:hypothetical protein AB0E78_38460 [Streptomyces sp. NPDC032198]|uniref:hypothetical protein n=1 Tax=Streptomyces sp. NPDC032198 TaxID=3155127 RepID=UPI0033D43DC1
MILTPREIARIGLGDHYADEFYSAAATRRARRAFRHRDKRRTRTEIKAYLADSIAESEHQ